MDPGPVFLHHESSLRHETGPHPERAARIAAIQRELIARDWLGYERIESPEVDRDVLTAVHPASHVEMIKAYSARGGGQIDLDTITSSGSYEAALHGAGGAVRAAQLLLAGEASVAFSAHRPPGHHAERSKAMGFCLFNNVAVAAQWALLGGGLERVMIVDWDVHHGNGTNDIFHASRDVLFVSIHQTPLYPGTGPASDLGSGDGMGYTVNLPVPPGSGDATFGSLVAHVAVPLARAFKPQLLLISAGYDAHVDDPLAECTVTDDGYATMAALLGDAAREVGAPLGVVLEGGYNVEALARSVAATMAALTDVGAGPREVEIDPLARAAASRLEPWWPGLS